MRWRSLSLLVCFLVDVVSGAEKSKANLPSSELTWKEKMKYKVPPAPVVLPPGVGLCMKGLPSDQCSIRYGGGRGLSEITRKSIVKRLKKQGWVKTKKLPRHINSVHICCHRKKFGMELKPKSPKDEKPIEWPYKKKPKKDTEKSTWKGIDEAEKLEKGIQEKTETFETENKTKEKKGKPEAIATKPKKKSDEIKKKAKKTAMNIKRRGKETVPKRLAKREKEPELGKNKTKETKWMTEFGKKKKTSKESKKKSGGDKTFKPEKKSGKEEEKSKKLKLSPWMTKDVDKKLPERYLEGEELIDESNVW